MAEPPVGPIAEPVVQAVRTFDRGRSVHGGRAPAHRRSECSCPSGNCQETRSWERFGMPFRRLRQRKQAECHCDCNTAWRAGRETFRRVHVMIIGAQAAHSDLAPQPGKTTFYLKGLGWLGRQDPQRRPQPLPEGVETRTLSSPTPSTVQQPCVTGKGGSGCRREYGSAAVRHPSAAGGGDAGSRNVLRAATHPSREPAAPRGAAGSSMPDAGRRSIRRSRTRPVPVRDRRDPRSRRRVGSDRHRAMRAGSASRVRA